MASSLLRGTTLAALLIVASSSRAAPLERGLVDSPDTTENMALLVGVSHGLAGLDIDMSNMEKIATHSAYHFKVAKLVDEQGTVSAVEEGLSDSAQRAGRTGTLLFYFTGHGNVGLIWPQDDTMKIEAIRQAIEDGRRSLGPLARLVMIYDSCHSGSLLDPMRTSYPLSQLGNDDLQASRFADAVVRAFSPALRSEPAYWSKLMVIASSRSSETSLASDTGSVFTKAFAQAFEETVQTNGTNADLIDAATRLTVELAQAIHEKPHHPVARLVPQSLADEKLIR
jgi:hypothetical protein